MTGFGMVPICNEGAPIHPDALILIGADLTHEERRDLLIAYYDHYSKESDELRKLYLLANNAD